MSVFGKLKKKAKKAAKKAVKRYGKVAVRAGAAYMTGGASEAYMAKAQGFQGMVKSARRNARTSLRGGGMIPSPSRMSRGGGFAGLRAGDVIE